jgi:hypothetical protein
VETGGLGPQMLVKIVISKINMSAKTWSIVLVVLLLLLLVGLVIGLSCSPSHRLDSDLNYKAQKALPSLSKFASELNSKYSPSDDPLPLTVPMSWDDDEGGYMVIINVSNAWVELVFDSGSSHISAKGLNCQWKQCDDSGNCTLSSCPKTSAFIPRGPQVSLNKQSSSLLEYGSQKSSVTHHVESFSLLNLHPNCADFMRAGNFKTVPEFLEKLYPLGASTVTFGPTLLYNIYLLEGSTTSNIFGVAQDNEPHNQSLLDAFFPPSSNLPKIWSITCRPSHALFSLGPLRCYGTPKFVPLLFPSAFKKFLTIFYIVRLREVRVINGSEKKSVKKSVVPKFVVLDTGTTYTYCNSALAAGLTAAGYNRPTSHVELVFGSSVNNLTLHYKPQMLQNAFLTDLTELDSMFGNVPILLMGVEQMFHFYFEYNLTTQMLGIVDISAL